MNHNDPSPAVRPRAWILYGANGYTGRLIAVEAARRGLRPVLAARSREKVEPLAAGLGLEWRSFPLDSPEGIAREIAGATAVLNCAGPFSATAAQTMDACIAAGAHYLDITGEIDVIEAAAARGERARAAGIALIPAVGFDVVPTDCLAAAVAERMPGARLLQIAFQTSDRLSPGTMKTMIETAPGGGRARIGGKIVRVPIAWKAMEVPFRGGKRWAVTIPWGDVASAYHSTGIPDIEVYAAASRRRISSLRRWRFLAPLSGFGPLKRWLARRAERTVRGPTEEELDRSRASLWARVVDSAGRSLEATLETPGAYRLTVLCALAAMERVLDGRAPPGFSTPSRAFTKDLITSIPGTDLRFETEGGV
jgi:short subunit dehydrogenase-like uncharacterized protein